MKLLTTVYKVEDPPIGSLEEIPPLTARLFQKRLSDGRELTCLHYDGEEKITHGERSMFNEEGQPLVDTEYEEDLKTAVFRKIYRYNERGKQTEERSIFSEDNCSGTRYRYDVKGNVSEETHFTDSGDDWYMRYEWHPQWKDCCVREEHSKRDGLPPKIVKHEWRMEKGEPFLFETSYHFPTQKYEDRIVRYYDPKTKENGVAWEVYNDQGDFLEEERRSFDSKGQLIHTGRFTDDSPEALPYFVSETDYDERGNVVRYAQSDRYQHYYRYDSEGRITHDLTSSELLIYEYEEVADDFKLF